ncbi:MAG: hypothetical protein NT067_00570 [Candidatus Diapherotrites archaeon]|nr:hypothetical protein [Candidatus Diapherotrites archaeon]
MKKITIVSVLFLLLAFSALALAGNAIPLQGKIPVRTFGTFTCKTLAWNQYSVPAGAGGGLDVLLNAKKCTYGCNKATGRCYSAPKPKWSCRRAPFAYEVQVNEYTGKEISSSKKFCGLKSCNFSTGRCRN